jgi:hypothetical protein
MKQAYEKTAALKVTFYTHPLCKVSWQMQHDWTRFYSDYRNLASFKICMGEMPLNSDALEKPSKSAHICLAVKAASLQSELAGHLYLGALREAIWGQNVDFSSLDVLIAIARKVNQCHRGQFDFNRFAGELTGKYARLALQEDLRKFHVNRVHLLPTITFTRQGKGIKLEGFRGYRQLAQTFTQLIGPPPVCTGGSIVQKAPVQLGG